MTHPAAPSSAHAWRRFRVGFAAAAALLTVALYLFIIAMDPYGRRAGPGRPPTPVMDVNQRYMYPQLVRGAEFDAAVFGTSTVRLLEPGALSREIGGRFANLAMNAATPWEQVQLADLFLRRTPAPRALILGLDSTWCEADADGPGKRVTFRSFPPWLYDESPWNDYPELLDFRSLEIAGRVALHRLGLMPERIRRDGYEVFVPPDETYDLARARFHIWGAAGPSPVPDAPPPALAEDERTALRFPALGWLDDLLARVPQGAFTALVLPPVHVASQPRPGSREAAREAACKEALAGIARLRGAGLVDFRLPSAVTRDDANYWDALHYRIGVAGRIVAALGRVRRGEEEDGSGFFRVTAPPPRGPA